MSEAARVQADELVRTMQRLKELPTVDAVTRVRTTLAPVDVLDLTRPTDSPSGVTFSNSPLPWHIQTQ